MYYRITNQYLFSILYIIKRVFIRIEMYLALDQVNGLSTKLVNLSYLQGSMVEFLVQDFRAGYNLPT